jgi:uncharacterized protein (DUF924 family)
VTVPETVLTYWFGDSLEGPTSFPTRVRWWFESDPKVDQETTERFGPLVKSAHEGKLTSWGNRPADRLALILLLDQFSRRVYRGTPNAYQGDPTATFLAVEGLRIGMDESLGVAERVFFSMPLGHAENHRLQKVHLQYMEHLPSKDWKHIRAVLDAAVGHARQNFNTIGRFGRFPQRNAILGRPSTPDELAFVQELVRKKAPMI